MDTSAEEDNVTHADSQIEEDAYSDEECGFHCADASSPSNILPVVQVIQYTQNSKDFYMLKAIDAYYAHMYLSDPSAY